MAKKYTDELAEWVKARPDKKPRQDLAAVAFLTVKPDVQAAIDAGYSLATIWGHMHETKKLNFSYETFRKHVRKRIKKGRALPVTEPLASDGTLVPAPAPAATEPARPRKQSQAPTKGSIPGFIFDPKQHSKDLL
jgi:hypothetical protein